MGETEQSAGNGICEKCPLDLALRAAEELVHEQPAETHSEPERALGGIALTRSCLEKVASLRVCTQPQTGLNDEPKCPLYDLTMSSRAYAFSPWRSDQFAVKLDKLAAPEKETSQRGHGQYL